MIIVENSIKLVSYNISQVALVTKKIIDKQEKNGETYL